MNRLKVIGYCELDEQALLKKFLSDGAGALKDLRGEYTIVVEMENRALPLLLLFRKEL